MMAWTLSAKIRFCVADKLIQYFAFLLRSSMNLMIHFARFLCVCNYFCVACIVVETNCTPSTVKEMFAFLLYECVHSPYNFFTFFSFGPSPATAIEQWSRARSTGLVNCTLVRNLCVIHHSWWNSSLVVFELHEYRPNYRFEASAVKATRPILTREFSFQLILGFCTLSLSQYWKFYRPIRCSRFFTVTSIVVSK